MSVSTLSNIPLRPCYVTTNFGIKNLNINEKNIGSISFSFSAFEPAFK